jgi:hypothetical protein
MSSTISGKLVSIIHGVEGPESGTVQFELCGYGGQTPRSAAHQGAWATFARVMGHPIQVDPGTGGWETTVIGNDAITPQGTYYTVTTRNDNGDITQVNAYYFLDWHDYNLDVTDPFDPGLPAPPLPPLIIPQLETITGGNWFGFDAGTYTAFEAILDQDATLDIAHTVIGNLYTFIIRQDATGYRNLTWPFYITNSSPINPEPNGITIQTFVATDESVQGNLVLYPISGATWWTP